ncbi:TauD/TfdA family dioxygenase [Streptomyces sp. NPDC001787]|uniref:TauD/TfdA family dioxygenase n=1 Tax=Streptomyces sp. NPDC001787 TaxID=3154523 RepID=UPI003327D90B
MRPLRHDEEHDGRRATAGEERVLAYRAIPAEATVALAPEELDHFVREAARIRAAHVQDTLDNPRVLAAAEIAAQGLPDRLLTRLIELRTLSGSGAILIKGLPVEGALPDTPAGVPAPPAWPALAVSTLAQLSIMSVLGDTISYADEKGGSLIQDVCPVPGAEARQENTGSQLLELHTEDGFHPFKPDFLSLYCLRGDHDRVAGTVTASIGSVLGRLPRRCRQVLGRPLFRIRYSSSFVGDGPECRTPEMPVLSGPPHDPDLCVDFHAMEGTTQESKEALELLYEAMKEELAGVVLAPGDMIVIDNRVAVHGRTGFRPKYDGRDRWLRRCFAVADLRPSRVLRDRGTRVCASIL